MTPRSQSTICCENQEKTEVALPEAVAVLIVSMTESGVFRKIEVVDFSGVDEPFGLWHTRLWALARPKDKVPARSGRISQQSWRKERQLYRLAR